MIGAALITATLLASGSSQPTQSPEVPEVEVGEFIVGSDSDYRMLRSTNLPGGMELEIIHGVDTDGWVSQANYSFLDYLFSFPSGRRFSARAYHDTFSEVSLNGCSDAGADDRVYGTACREFPEYREVILALAAFHFHSIGELTEAGYKPVDVAALDIDQQTVFNWIPTEYPGEQFAPGGSE